MQVKKKALERIRYFAERQPEVFLTALAATLALVLEALGRHSPLGAAGFVLHHPVHFLANTAIILLTLAVTRLFRRRRALLPAVAGLWLALGVINAVVRIFRATPLSSVDVVLLPSAFSVVTLYVDTWLLILLGAAAAAGLIWALAAFFRHPGRPVAWKRSGLFVLAAAVAAAGLYGVAAWGRREERAEDFSNLIDAYDRYGFAYCFCTGMLDRGIGQPDPYSRTAVKRITSRLKESAAPSVEPDIVMVQLESFFDVSHLDDVTVEEDPTPVFRELKERFSSGFLTVPSVGAGTANTEFEVLSGMSLDFFGMGEVPYMTILQEKSCETVAADLKTLGYSAHAVHNNTGIFYSRNSVFSQLGFDTFTSIEFMNDVTYNPIGWARDETLLAPIAQALDSGEEPQFVFVITVQDHGKYQPDVDDPNVEELDVTWADDEEDEDALGYYLSQLKETDAFLGQLIQALEQRDRPAVLVAYGDHLPNFDIGSEQLENGDIFQTEYVIWNNMDLPVRDEDLNAYQLSARVLEDLGMSGGVLSRYHQQRRERSDYQRGLEMLEYDMLYGEYYCGTPYEPSQLHMGLEELAVTDVRWADGTLTVTGTGLTDWSRIVADGDELDDTVLTSPGTVSAPLDEPPEPGAEILLRQRAQNMTGVLAESEPYIWDP